ncbi:MAG: hypothetical protein V3T21_05645 [Candidatus Margulisiibacteriota bacterium]
MLQTTRGTHLNRPGITLIELVFSMALSLVILLVVVLAYLVGIRSFTQEMSRFDIFWDAHQGLGTITGDIRECDDVISAQAGSIEIWLDLNGDTTMEANEVVGYALSGQNLIRTIGSESKPVVHNIVGFDLEYDNPAYPTLVTVTLTMLKEGNLATLESKADIRSR